MAKTANDSTVPPLRYGAGEAILYEAAQVAVELQHYAVCEQTTTYLSMICSVEWDTPDNPGFVTLAFPSDSTPYQIYDGWIWIDPDYQTITFEAQCSVTGSDTVEVELTLGGDTVTLTGFTGTSNESDTLATADTGTGWQEFTITITHLTGSDPAFLNYLVWTSSRISAATSLPDPSG